MAHMSLQNETSVNDMNAATVDGSPGIDKAAFFILVFEAFKSHPLGWLGFLIFLTGWTALGLPVTVLEVCAGFVWGPVWGTLASFLGKTFGCICALFIGRMIGKSRGWRMPAALEQYLGLLKTRPFETMCAVRVAPIPQGVKNYGLSLVRYPNDKYPYQAYIWSCFLVGLPFSIGWGLAGQSASSLVELVGAYV